MPRVEAGQEVPLTIRQLRWHGIEIEYRAGEKDAYGSCPLCGREKKFSLKVETGQWRCFACNFGTENGKTACGGNLYTLLRLIALQAEESAQREKDEGEGSKGRTGIPGEILRDLAVLAAERGLLSTAPLSAFGIFRSPLTGELVVPGYDPSGKLMQLYVWRQFGSERRISVTPGTPHQLMGIPLFVPSKPDILLCEGWGDTLSLWEALSITSLSEEGEFVLSSSPEESLLAEVNVLGIPSCNTFAPSWLPLFAGKNVYLLFDSDHPRETTLPSGEKRIQPPAGFEGIKRVSKLLASAASPPSSIKWLAWGEQGYHPDLPSGYDVRDWLTSSPTPEGKVEALSGLLSYCEDVPEAWVTLSPEEKKESESIRPISCESWPELINQWRKALRWTDGLDLTLSVMLSAVISTPTHGEQLWIRCLARPSSGKTTLAEALCVARKYVHPQDELKKLHSGYKEDKEGTEDFSLLALIDGKTLVIKDADPVLKSPDRGVILSQLRAYYDGTLVPHYNNGIRRSYKDRRSTVILCGTAAVRELDAAELGARFLDVSVMEEIDEELEEEITFRAIMQELQNVKTLSNGKAESKRNPSLVKAMAMTGGYVEYLRENAEKLIGAVEVSEAQAMMFVRMGVFISFMRARESKAQDEVTEREFSPRLGKQLVRLAACLPAVMGKQAADSETVRRIRKVAADTSKGKTLQIAGFLFSLGERGSDTESVARALGRDGKKTEGALLFLQKIGVVTLFDPSSQWLRQETRWVLTPRLRELYAEVMG